MAQYDGVSATATLTVTSATLVSLTVTPDMVNLPLGLTQQYEVEAIYSDGTSINVTNAATWTCSNTAIAAVSDTAGSKGLATPIAPGNTTISVFYGTLGVNAGLTVTSATVKSLVITPATATVAVGTIQQFEVAAIYTDGTSANVTASATWTSSNAAAATVSNTTGTKGRATPVAAGTTTIKAQYSGLSATASLTVTTATITQIQITPFNPSMPIGFGQALTATALYSDGTKRDVTTAATWTSSDPGSAPVSDTGATKGQVTPEAVAVVTITATYLGVSGTTTVNVTNATLKSISVTPSTTTVASGAVAQLTATATFTDGTTANVTTEATWTTSDGTVAQVSNAGATSGQLSAFKAGSVTVTATLDGISGTAKVTVD
jgi:hypothetical protein